MGKTHIQIGPRLPKEYQEVEYISSVNGGQYIDTGVLLNYTRGFDVIVDYARNASARYCLLANYNTPGKIMSLELDVNNRARFWMWTGSVDQRVGNCTTNRNRSIFSFHNGVWTVTCNQDRLSGNFTTATGDAGEQSLWMFLDRAKRTSTFSQPLKIYACIINDGGVIIRNFVPCYRKADTVIGMYDLVDEQFYTNLGTGNFTKGDDISSYPGGKIGIDHEGEYILGSPAVPETTLLPNLYQRVAYIEGSGSQYIDTGLPVHMNWKYEIVFQQNTADTYRGWGAFNQSSYVGPNCSLTYISNPKTFALRWESQANNQRYLTLGTIDTQKHTLLVDNGEAFFDGVDKGKTAGHNASFVSNCNAFLFTINPKETAPTATLNGKVYSYRVWNNNNVLQQWFVPCFNKKTNQIGMYDIIGKSFYINIGSGTFTKGASII